jgi:phosphonate transport system permease protein
VSALAPAPPRPFLLRPAGLALVLLLAVAWHGAGGSLAALLGADARAALAEFARGFWPPAHSRELLAGLARPLAETCAIAAAGLGAALLLAAPLTLAAVHPVVWQACGHRPGAGLRALHAGSRLVLSFLRAVPEVIWALLFVRALGLGPAPGVVALALAYAGVLGKVYAEILESAPRGAAGALAAAGAPPLRALLVGIGAGARPQLVSYTLYRADCALRASAVLGIVGAGGLGQRIELALRMLAYDEVATLVLALFALVAGADLASGLLRRRLARRGSLFPASAAAALRDAAALATPLALAAGGAAFLGLSPALLVSADARAGLLDFARQLFPPDLSAAALRPILPAALETVAMAFLGTAMAAGLGIVLGLAAARPPALEAGAGRAGRLARAALAGGARTLLNAGRTLPELLWALALVFAVGLGPFAGALALGIHTAGVLGRLYAEALEEAPAAPLAALRAAGASRTGALLLAALPQASAQLAAYTLYRFEVNVRAAAVLGVVGAGGLGRDLKLALSWFDYGRAATLVLALLAIVFLMDLASGALRARLVVSAGVPLGADAQRD